MNKPTTLPDRVCNHCGKIYNRTRMTDGTLERPSKYVLRKTCSIECRAANQLKITTEKKPCAGCGATLLRKRDKAGRLETAERFNNRVMCNRGCEALVRISKTEKKFCKQCSKPLVRKMQGDNRLESTRTYSLRRFCDRACHNEYRRKPAPPVDDFAVCINPQKVSSPTVVVKKREPQPPRPVEFVAAPAPADAQHINPFGTFKMVGNRVFRHDGFEWILSNFPAKELQPKQQLKRRVA